MWFLALLLAVASHAATDVALTFDDLAPQPAVLPTLIREKIPGVIAFVTSDDRPETAAGWLEFARNWSAAGYLFGNHTAMHADLNKVSAAQYEREITQLEPRLRSFAGETNWHFFRYPFLHEGDTNAKRNEVRGYLKKRGYTVAPASITLGDAPFIDAYVRCLGMRNEAELARLRAEFVNYAVHQLGEAEKLSRKRFHRSMKLVLLLHAEPLETDALPELLAAYRKAGARFVPFLRAIRDPAYRSLPAFSYPAPQFFFFEKRSGESAPPILAELAGICKP